MYVIPRYVKRGIGPRVFAPKLNAPYKYQRQLDAALHRQRQWKARKQLFSRSMHFIQDPETRNNRNRERAIRRLKKNGLLEVNNRFWTWFHATKKHIKGKKDYYERKRLNAYGIRQMYSNLNKYGL